MDFDGRLQSHALYDYSAQNWGHHARTSKLVETELEDLILDFLRSEAKVSASSQAMMAANENNSRRVLTGVHLAAFFGLEKVILTLLEKDSIDLNSKDNYGRTALSWAAGNGHEAVVKLLLEAKAEVDSKG